MDTLTREEQSLFSKWYGDADIAQKPEYWEDVLDLYSKAGIDVPLPIGYNPQSVRMVLDTLKCPPGECGLCCHYGRIPVHLHDVERIAENTDFSYKDLTKLITVKDGKNFFEAGERGCPFLKDNKCSIYAFRPDGCYLFPIQSPVEASANGHKVQQMRMRIKCRPALGVARKIILKALGEGNRLLLPNLIIIDREDKGNGTD